MPAPSFSAISTEAAITETTAVRRCGVMSEGYSAGTAAGSETHGCSSKLAIPEASTGRPSR